MVYHHAGSFYLYSYAGDTPGYPAFLVYSHPQIYQLVDRLAASGAALSEADLALFRQWVVEVIYRNSRAIDHNTTFLKVVYDAIHEQQMMTYEYSLPFIKF